MRGLSAQAQPVQRDGQRCGSQIAAHPRAPELHRRAERRAGQGLVPDRRPTRSRRGEVINDGKLAVVLGHRGLEAVRLRRLQRPPDVRPGADRPPARRGLRARRAPAWSSSTSSTTRSAGVAGDGGATGRVINGGNKLRDRQVLADGDAAPGDPTSDRQATSRSRRARRSDALFGNGLSALLRPGRRPSIPTAPHCNTRGLTDLGEHLVERMIDQADDHRPRPPERARRATQALALVEAERYSGVVSSHSWSTPDAIPRIYNARRRRSRPTRATRRASSRSGRTIKPLRDRASTSASATART